LFNAPDRTTCIKGAFLTYERGRRTCHDQDVIIARLLTNQGSDDPGNVTELDMEDIVDCLSTCVADPKRNLSCWLNGDVYEPRLLRWREKREFRFRRGWEQVHKQVGREAI